MSNRSPFGNQWWGLIFSLAGFALLVDPMRRHAGGTEMALTIAGVVVFIALYAALLIEWKKERSGLWHTLAIALVGVVFAPFNPLAWIFSVVAAAFAACVAVGHVRTAVLIVGGIVAAAVIEKLIVGLPWSSVLQVAGFGIPISVMCALTVRRATVVRELARHNERERIARDMHDVLGHTLSLIILKTDLALRLAHSDPDRVVKELTELDQIARATLDEVRETVRGYRARSLKHEFDLAQSTLTIAGVTVTAEFEPPELNPTQENALCLALREGVTNVVRHARAKHCKLSVTARRGNCLLEIEDDGDGDPSADPSGNEDAREAREIERGGTGLHGMRERVSASGGVMTHQQTHRGTMLHISLPLMPDKA